MEAAKKPGRPPKGAFPMTPAQRVKESRERAHRAMLEVIEDLPGSSTKALLGNLNRQFKYMAANDGHEETARWVAAQVIGELCNRFKIEPVQAKRSNP